METDVDDGRTSHRQLRIVLLNWRDTRHPEGGGSELYIETIGAGLAEAGYDVTLFCSAYDGAPTEETRDGFRIIRRGGKLSVYAHALWMLAGGRLGRPDVVVDVQNGVPFWSRLAARCPVVVLVHHVHREQWSVVYSPPASKIGWWLESRLAPRFYRRSRYVAVSGVTRAELVGLGVSADRVQVIHNGTAPAPVVAEYRSPTPRVCVLGRLVPHKRVEHALHAAARLRGRWPALRVSVVGDGWWADELQKAAAQLGVADITEFHGHVDELRKHEELGRAWLLAAPSLKEGWGLVVVEAAQHGVPTVGYRSAGGLAESIIDGETGLLVDDLDDFVAAVETLLADHERRTQMGLRAASMASRYEWSTSIADWDRLLQSTVDKPRDTAQRLP